MRSPVRLYSTSTFLWDLPSQYQAVQVRGGASLDNLTYSAIARYLDYRHGRWPRTANPHLLITQQTAHNTEPVNRVWLRYAVRDRQATLSGLRQDRILDEAEAVGIPDPLHVAAIFGLHPDTAQRYVDAFYGRADRSAPE
ncbi:hypothetical protein [Streptomyces sp. NPDC052036]|uniref:hypothetical protein n=1 Tax=unclassified Streptomyces TaxID=2593676 RepID=UPI0034196D7D